MRSQAPHLRTNTDPIQDDPSFTRPQELNSILKPGRTPATWSTEARDIEKSLGVSGR